MHTPKPTTIAPPTPAPPPPTIDQAVNQSRQNDLLRQRRGAASNILAGQNPQSPTTLGISSLLGS